MKNLFNLENPFFQFMSRVCDMIILNLLFIICCIPVVTIGASLCALHQTMQDILYEVETGYIKRFFHAFKINFKQGTILWLVTLVVIASLGCDYIIITGYCTGVLATVLYVLLAVLAVLVVAVVGYMFPLIVRYNNTMRQHLYNAIILSIIKLPKTIGIVALIVLPFLLAVFALNTFVSTLVFWVIIGFSFEAFLASSLVKPIFRELEQAQQGEGSVSIMK